MDPVRYIHAADLHLDTPFQGLSYEAACGGHLTRLLHEATFTALERLFRLCETEKPDFLILAGDVYNQEDHSVKAQLALRDGCVRLQKLHIPVFLAHGNHDPLSSRLGAVHWPDNLHIFGPEAEQHLIEKNGKPLAVIHGISHATARESRNLAKFFHRDPAQDCFQLGVLHCTVDGETKADRYAPCALEDLTASGLDAWALGHVHERRELCATPYVAYAGNTQGLHINDCGPRGCLLVTATPQGTGFQCAASFRLLGPVQWQQVTVDVDGLEQLDDVDQTVNTALETLRTQADPACEALIARVTLTGRTTLDSLLHKEDCQNALLERLRDGNTGTPPVLIKDMRVQTRPLADRQAFMQREDLLGQTVRLSQSLQDDAVALHDLSHKALAPVYEHSTLRKILSTPDEAQTRALLQEAERLCMDMLEAR